MLRRVTVAIAVCLAASLTSVTAQAEPDAEAGLAWNEDWPRVRPVEYVATGALVAGVIVSSFAVPQGEDSWRGGILFDDAARDALVLESAENRRTLRSVGDGLYWGLMLYPAVVDVGLLTLGAYGSPDVAWQLVFIDGQSLALSGLLATVTERIGRDRPFVGDCPEDPQRDPDCHKPEARSRSFISGHLTMAATGASLTCTHAIHLGLYGGTEGAALACSTAFAGVALVATSRLLSDRHYVSDLAVAAAVGVSSGLVLPHLLHFGFGASEPDGARAVVSPWAQSDGFGLSVSWMGSETF